MTILQSAAEFVAHARFSAVERKRAEMHLGDALVALLCGMHTEEGRLLIRLWTDERMPFTSILRRDTLDDICMLSAVTRLTEIDDIHLASCTTPGSVVIPAVLCLAPHVRPDSEEKIWDAVIVGYDLMTRLGRAIRGAHVLSRGIWPTYFCAAFGSAASASRLLGLSESGTAHALALALTLSSGGVSRSPERTFRWLSLGHAARSGVLAALAAAGGYQGDTGMLDHGWLSTTYGLDADPDQLVDRLGIRRVMDEMSFKLFCSAKQVMPAIYALRKLMNRGVSPGDIRAIRLRVPGEFAGMIGGVPRDRLTSLTSASYQLSLAAWNPAGLLDIERKEFRIEDKIRDFMGIIRVEADAALSAAYPERWVTVLEAETAEGPRTETAEEVPGDPGMRPSRQTLLFEKWHKLLERQKISSGNPIVRMLERGPMGLPEILEVYPALQKQLRNMRF